MIRTVTTEAHLYELRRTLYREIETASPADMRRKLRIIGMINMKLMGRLGGVEVLDDAVALEKRMFGPVTDAEGRPLEALPDGRS